MGAGIERKYYVFALRAFSDITATIVVPAVLVVVLRYAAHITGTLFYVLLAVAFVGTALILRRKMKLYGDAFEQLNQASGGDGSPRR